MKWCFILHEGDYLECRNRRNGLHICSTVVATAADAKGLPLLERDAKQLIASYFFIILFNAEDVIAPLPLRMTFMKRYACNAAIALFEFLQYNLTMRAFSTVGSILIHTSIDCYNLLQLLLFISFVALHYFKSEIRQRHLLVANRTIFLLSYKTRILFHPFGANCIFLSLFVFEIFIFKVRLDFWITRYI